MLMEQTVEIPVNHRLTLDIPAEIPAGKAVLELKFTPLCESHRQTGETWVNPLKGICKDSKMTLERFRETQLADKELEEALDRLSPLR